MKSFKDLKARDWYLALDYHAFLRCKQVGVDLGSAWTGDLFVEFERDIVKTYDCLWAVVQKHAEERKLSKDDFVDAIDGQVIEDALEALAEALTNFFGRRQGGVFKIWWQGHLSGLQQTATKLLEQFEQLSLLGTTSNGSSGNSRESSESTPESLASVN